MDIFKHEFYKIASKKITYILMLAFMCIYTYTTKCYYTWNNAISWNRIIDFCFKSGSLYTGIIALIILCPRFTNEYVLDTYSIIACTKHGKKKFITAKITSSIVFISLVNLFFHIFNLVLNYKFKGLEGFNEPLQVLNKYTLSPYNYTILQFWFIQILINTLGIIAFSIFILYLSSATNSILKVFFIGGLVFTLPFPFRELKYFSIEWIIKYLSYTDFIRVQSLFNKPRVYSLFGITIQHKNLMYLFITILSIIFINKIYKKVANKTSLCHLYRRHTSQS